MRLYPTLVEYPTPDVMNVNRVNLVLVHGETTTRPPPHPQTQRSLPLRPFSALGPRVPACIFRLGHILRGIKLKRISRYEYSILFFVSVGMSPNLAEEQTSQESQEVIPNISFLIPKSEASSVLGRDRRSSMERGIYCECCLNPCSVGELTQYCAARAASGKKRAPSATYLSKLPIKVN